MIPDILALARDVDRLFRARQDGRQMPVGETAWGELIAGGLKHRLWTPDDAEWHAYLFERNIGGIDPFRGPNGVVAPKLMGSDKSYFRTRRHVAMLALTEPAHFKECLAKLVDHYADKVARCTGALRDIGLEDPRTARYLQDLDARLTEWREAEAVRAAIEARDREIVEQDALAAAAQEPIPQEDEDAIMAIA